MMKAFDPPIRSTLSVGPFPASCRQARHSPLETSTCAALAQYLSDREAGKIWDAYLSSVRLRYRAVAPKPPSAFDQVGNRESCCR